MIEICLCYASEDEILRQALEKQLRALQRQNLFIALWHSHNISAGEEWAYEIERHLNTAQIILLLLSADFLASDDFYNRMVKPAMERHERGVARVIPVILRPVHWQDTSLGKLQALPTGGIPVVDGSWHNLDEALFDVVISIRRVVEELTTKVLFSGEITSGTPVTQSETTTLPSRDEANFVLAQTLVDHLGPIASLAFLDEQTVVSDGWDHTIKFWDLHTGRVVRSIMMHSSQVYSIAVNRSILVCGSDDGTILVGDVENGQLTSALNGHTGPVASIAFSPYGVVLVSGGDDTLIKLWDMETRSAIQTIKQHTGPVASVAFSPGGKWIASGGYDRTIIVKECGHTIGDITDRYDFPLIGDGFPLIRNGHTEAISSISFHPGSDAHVVVPRIGLQPATEFGVDILASGSHDATIKIWDIYYRRVLSTLVGHMGPVSSIAFSPDGTMLVSGSYDKTVKLWDVTTGELLTTLKGHTEAVLCVAFHPRGDMIVSGGLDKTIKLWKRSGRASSP